MKTETLDKILYGCIGGTGVTAIVGTTTTITGLLADNYKLFGVGTAICMVAYLSLNIGWGILNYLDSKLQKEISRLYTDVKTDYENSKRMLEETKKLKEDTRKI